VDVGDEDSLGLEDSPAISKPVMVIMVILPIPMGSITNRFQYGKICGFCYLCLSETIALTNRNNKTVNLCGDSILQASVSKKRKINLCSLQCSKMQ